MPKFSPQKSFDFFRKAGGNTEVPLAPRSVVWVKPGKPNADWAAPGMVLKVVLNHNQWGFQWI